jgi:GntR family transcriptional regulator, arabinose operon transcriptional repressor
MSTEPKYQLVKDFIIDYITSGELKYNDRIFSEAELTDRFSISRHTVRKAIDDLVKDGWLYKQQGKGTFVSDPCANQNQSGKLIGVVTTYFKDYIFPDIIAGIDEVLGEHGYSILLGSTNNDTQRERTILSNMLNNQLAGLIVEPTRSTYPNYNLDIYEQFRGRGIPILFIHGSYSNFPASYVIEDDVQAGFLATEHLIELGHHQIGGVFKSDDVQGHGRYQGYIKALRKHAIDIDESKVLWFTTSDRKKILSDEHWPQLQSLILSCTALVCYNDEITVVLINIMKQHACYVPQDISLVSFDNSNLAQSLEIKLTTVAHPKSKLGCVAAEGLLKMIEDRNCVIEEVMAPELIVRDTTRENNER